MDSDDEYEEHDESGSSDGQDGPGRKASQSVEAGTVKLEELSDSKGSEYLDESASSVSESDDLGDRQLPRKRPADETTSHRPFKRQRSQLNPAYLELLNREIMDAAQRTTLDNVPDLLASQIGLTHWSSHEKHKFFEALARLGKNDVAAISSAVGTKSIVEVSQYVTLLEDARNERLDAGMRPVLEPYRYPAAMEISQQCIHAQEEAADEIHLRQEAREEQREQNRWKQSWNVTEGVSRKWSRQARDPNHGQLPPFAHLFHTSRWLKLSRCLFMNSSVPSNNWTFAESEPPSIWATAFEDFHSLAVSITRRLVQAALFMAMSRIRAKRDGGTRLRDHVLRQDVEAAISSLGMPSDMRQPWIACARRLRLDVYEDPSNGEESDEEKPPLPYDEVERRLSGGQAVSRGPSSPSDVIKQTKERMEHANEIIFEGSGEETSDGSTSSPSDDDDDDEEQQEIKREAAEVFVYAAAGLRQDLTAKRALRARIAMERQQEQQADEWDEHASYRAELELWSILGKKPPAELPKKSDPGPPKRSHLKVEGMYCAGRDWMRKLNYYSEWETLPTPDNDDMNEADDDGQSK